MAELKKLLDSQKREDIEAYLSNRKFEEMQQ
jgi:hypothetical protein